MKSSFFAALAALAIGQIASASATRTLDGQQITNGSAILTLPTSTDTLAGVAQTQTLTNKSISGATNTITAIPAATALSGVVPTANGGTGLSSATAHGVVVGAGAGNPLSVTSSGSQYQPLVANGSSADPTFQALPLNQSAAVTGSLPVTNGGTGLATLTSGSVLVGAGTASPTLVAPGTTGNVLTSSGGTWVSAAVPTSTPSINGGSGAPESLSATSTVSLSSIAYSNLVWIASSSGAVTLTSTPSVTAGTADGQKLNIIGTSATNTVTLQDKANLAGSGLSLNGNWVGGKDSNLSLHWDQSQSLWVEDARR